MYTENKDSLFGLRAFEAHTHVYTYTRTEDSPSLPPALPPSFQPTHPPTFFLGRMVSYGDNDDALMQRILEESLNDANVRRASRVGAPGPVGMNDSMDEVLLAKALEDSLSFNKHVTNSAAKTETEEEAMIRQAVEESMKDAALPRTSKTERLMGTDSDTDESDDEKDLVQ